MNTPGSVADLVHYVGVDDDLILRIPFVNSNRLQNITVTATGGTFKVTIGHSVLDQYGRATDDAITEGETGPLAYNVSAAAMQTAIRALGGQESAGATVTLTGGVYTVTLSSKYAIVSVDVTALTGGTADVANTPIDVHASTFLPRVGPDRDALKAALDAIPLDWAAVDMSEATAGVVELTLPGTLLAQVPIYDPQQRQTVLWWDLHEDGLFDQTTHAGRIILRWGVI